MTPRPVRPSRRLLAGAVLGALLVGAAGCGADGGGAWQPPAQSRGGESAGRDPWRGADPDLPQRVGPRLTAENLYDRVVAAMRAAGTYTWTVDAGVRAGEGEHDAVLSGQVRLADDGTLAARGRSGDGSREFRWLDGTFHARDTARTGGRWVSAPARRAPSSAAGRALALVDPAVLLAPLADATGVQRDGVESVAGVPSQLYRVTVPREAWARRAGVPGDSVATPTVEVLVWVDARQRLRRFRQQVALVTAEVPEGVTTTVRGSFTRFGRPVRIEAPRSTRR